MKKFMAAAFEPGFSRKKLSGQLVWFGLWAVLTGIGLFLLSPNPDGHGTHTQLGLPACPSVVFFDRPCPGCGMTTSWTATIHGNLVRGFQVHPFGPILYLGFTATALMALYGFVKGLRLRSEHPGFNKLMVVVLIGFVGFGAIRFMTGTMDSRFSFRSWQERVSKGSSSVGEEGGGSAGVPEDGGSGQGAGAGQVE